MLHPAASPKLHTLRNLLKIEFPMAPRSMACGSHTLPREQSLDISGFDGYGRTKAQPQRDEERALHMEAGDLLPKPPDVWNPGSKSGLSLLDLSICDWQGLPTTS